MNTVIVNVRRLASANKAVAAGLTSLGLSLSAAAATWIQSGQFDAAEVRTSLGGLAASVIVAGATWLVSSGPAEVSVTEVTAASQHD